MADQIYSKKLNSLEIFGTIKIVSPSEYFLSNHGSNVKLLKIDKNCKEKIFAAEISEL